MLLFILVLLFVSLVDTSGLYLDDKLTELLYVDEPELEDEELTESEFGEGYSEVFGTKTVASEEEVMAALEQIYEEKKS